MELTLWGTRGSLPTPGAETARYGGNTSCASLLGEDGTLLVLDAGTGIRRLGTTLDPSLRRVDILLTHLHMDHIQGLGFFAPLYRPDCEVHVWGPAGFGLTLEERLMRYLSPPLFPVRLKELPCRLAVHELTDRAMAVGGFEVLAAHVCHPGPTVGYRVTGSRGRVVTYLPDHEPALGPHAFPSLPREWTSGGELAAGSDILVHDCQYTSHEYGSKVGWGHSAMRHALDFAKLADVGELVPFHYDPDHTDADLDRLIAEAVEDTKPACRVTPAQEGLTFKL